MVVCSSRGCEEISGRYPCTSKRLTIRYGIERIAHFMIYFVNRRHDYFRCHWRQMDITSGAVPRDCGAVSVCICQEWSRWSLSKLVYPALLPTLERLLQWYHNVQYLGYRQAILCRKSCHGFSKAITSSCAKRLEIFQRKSCVWWRSQRFSFLKAAHRPCDDNKM